MRKVVLMALLVVVSGSAMGEWVDVDRDNARGITLFVERNATQKSGNSVILKELNDYDIDRRGEHHGIGSVIVYSEYDCIEKKRRFIHLIYYAGAKGLGALLKDDATVDPWSPIVTGSPSGFMWKIACEKN